MVVGTDDGLVQITSDGGNNWMEIDNIPGAPNQSYVNSVFTSQHDKNRIYVAFNHHKYGDFKPYVFMSEDMGDMFVCRDVIKKNAKTYNKDFPEELQYIVIHGLLHLIGYSHKKNDKLKIYEAELMKRIWNES